MKFFMLCVSTIFIAVMSAAASPAPALRWEPWEVEQSGGTKATFELGRLTVPENRASASEKRIEVAFVRLPSTSKNPGPPIVYLNGGPGQAATPIVRYPQGLRSFEPLRALGDVILLDMRGSGLSEPHLRCKPAPPDRTFFSDIDGTLERLRAHLGRCAEELRAAGIDPGGFNTREAAHDLEDLRRALGAERLDLLAFSYGTHLAFSAIRDHGEHLGRVVAVAPEGPDHTWKLPSTFDAQLARISALAASDPAVGKEVPDMVALLRRVLTRLAREPITVRVADRREKKEVELLVSREGLQWILLQDVGDGNDFPWFPALLHQIDRGETGLLSWFVEKRWNQVGGPGSMLYWAVDCASGVSQHRLARIRAESRTALLGDLENGQYRACESIAVPDLGDAFRAPLISDVPLLLVSGTMDSNTPPFQAEEMRWGMANAVHLLVTNAGHEDLIPNPQVQQAIVRFLARENVGNGIIEGKTIEFAAVSETNRE